MFVKSVVLNDVQEEIPSIYLPENLEDESRKDLEIFLLGLAAATLVVKAELAEREYMIKVTGSDPDDYEGN